MEKTCFICNSPQHYVNLCPYNQFSQGAQQGNLQNSNQGDQSHRGGYRGRGYNHGPQLNTMSGNEPGIEQAESGESSTMIFPDRTTLDEPTF